jgi:prevent-host-death family protein
MISLKWLYFMAIIARMKVSVADAKNRLSELIKAAEGGEPVTICRHGKPVVDLVRTASVEPGKREFGTLRGQVIEIDPDWWKPMTDEEADDFLEGRY